ncbi:MAG: sigma 54-interacting transcriptional regulator [Acidobacteriia bacterium]|nr:sigma 54-interacting transcriptional regulator [Terriglobia bacterium]
MDKTAQSPSAATPAKEQYCALLEVSEAIAAHRDLSSLFQDLARRLHRVVIFDFLALILYEPARDIMRLHILESSIPPHAEVGMETPLGGTPAGYVVETQKPLVVQNLDQETRFPEILRLMRENGVKSFCGLPLTTAHRRVGVLGFGSIKLDAYPLDNLEFLGRVAAQVALAVDNALNFQNAQSYQHQLSRERDRLRVLLEVTNTLVANLDLRELLKAIAACVERVMHHEYTGLSLFDPASNQLRLHALDFPQGKGLLQEEMLLPLEGTAAGEVFRTRQPLLVGPANYGRFQADIARKFVEEGLMSACIVPLNSSNRALGTLSLASLREGAFTQEDVDLLAQVANQVAIAVENALAFQEIAELKNKLAEEKLYLEEEIRIDHNFEEIVGESTALKRVLSQAETVAPTDSAVLIQGETGTGKELVARAIHNLSRRRDRTFVKVKCAAIPIGLLESELFGHERGAFTGAIVQKVGRFELAHQGTLFLDEVGDIPLELQPKLLRVLQEKEFERLGGTRTIRIDVRVVAATNRDLAKMVAEGQFRSDLFYRLNVFPISMPPLRERPEDIPLLVRYFAQRFSRRNDKPIETIPSEDMEELTRYHWPGNARELENLIERAVILARGPVLRIPPGELTVEPETPSPLPSTLAAAEREHILRALRETNWVIGGPTGAAARLGLRRTTLQSRIKKLGISLHD